MDNGHLTDERIQEILDAQMLHSGPILPLHLGSCARCQARLESFRRMYAGLAADPGYVVPPSFAAAVLAKIPASRAPLWQRPWVKRALIAGAGAAGALALLLVLALFVDWRPLAAGSASIWAAVGRSFRPLGGNFRTIISGLGDSARPFLAGGLGLLGAALVERLLARQHMRHVH